MTSLSAAWILIVSPLAADMRFSSVVLLLVSAATLFASNTQAQPTPTTSVNYPSKPIRIIATLSAGSQVDILTRVVAEKLAANLKQPVLVENRTGAGGSIAAAAVANAPADGYTLLAATNGFAINPALYPKLSFDTQKAFVGVSLIGVVPSVLIAAPNKPFKNLPALIAAAKAKPGELTYASAGVGSASHLAIELMRDMANIDMQHIPYKGTTEAIADIVSGRVDFSIGPVGATQALMREGRAIQLAVTTRERSTLLPQVPTVDEAGFTGYRFDFWYGLMLPAATPRPIVEVLALEIEKVLAHPDVRAKFAQQGVMASSISPALTTQKFDQFIASEMARYAALVKKSGAKAE